MYFIFLLFFSINISAMKKVDAIEIPFTEDKKDKATCAVFIDESNIAIGGQGECFIANLRTQERSNINFIEEDEHVFNLCVNKDKRLLGFNTHKRVHLYNIQKKATNSPFLSHSCGSLSALGFNSDNEITISNEGHFTCFNEKLEIKEHYCSFPPGRAYHFKDNIFLFSFGNYFIKYKGCNNVYDFFKTLLHLYEIFLSPEHALIAVRTIKNRIFIVDTQKAPDKNGYAIATHISSKNSHYFAAAFYPKNTFLALLKTNGLLEYRDCIEPKKIVTTQKVINENLTGWNFNSVHFSPGGTKVAVIINGKCMLLDIPVDIQYPNGWLIYYCLQQHNIPKEVFFIIMDLINLLKKTMRID